MSRAPREIQFAEIERRFHLASYWFGERWCPAVQKYDRGTYSIRVLKSESMSGTSQTVTYDYFELDSDGTVGTAPRGYAKDFKPGRVVDIEAAVLRFAQPDVPAPGLRCPHCQTAVPAGMRFPTCVGCGRVLDVAVLGEEMQPPPCADHEASELNCPVCTAQRRAFYAALGREDAS